MTVYALLVGIDDYPAPIRKLRGCRNDTEAVAAVLDAVVPAADLSLVALHDGQATRSAVVQAFREHLGKAGPGDTAVFHFSGHGSSEPDDAGQHETIVLHDSRQEGGHDLADRELGLLVGEVGATAAHVVVALDCCHAGSGTRENDQRAARVIPPDLRRRTYLPGAQAPRTRTVRSWSAITADHVLLAACRAGQLAMELRIDGRWRGVFTAALESALLTTPTLTYYQLRQWTASTVRRWVDNQDPQLELVRSSDGELQFLGLAADNTTARHIVTHDKDGGWTVNIGSLHGVLPPTADVVTRFAFYSLRSDASYPLAVGMVTEVATDRSRVSVAPPTVLDPAHAYRAVVTDLPRAPAPVAVIGDSLAAQELRVRLASTFTLVDATDEDAVRVWVHDGTHTVTHPAGHQAARVSFTGPEAMERTLTAVHRTAQWWRLRGLRNPLSSIPTDAVTVELVDALGNSHRNRLRLAYLDPTHVSGGPPFTIRFTNTTSRPLWCAVIDLTADFYVFADAVDSGSLLVAPRTQEVVPLRAEIPDSLWDLGVTELDDLLKVVISTSEFDPRQLAGTARQIRPGHNGSSSATGWATRDLVVTTVRPR